MKRDDLPYSSAVRENDALRSSFNNLTRKTFGFDFIGWYQAGHWGGMYLPHVILDGDRVVSNVSVNLMRFDLGGVVKNYIQLGTVMTDAAYRGRGLNRRLMERVLAEYEGKTDGFYLFANDSVLDYYPKFGFRPSKEYEYYMPCAPAGRASPYRVEKIDLRREGQAERLYAAIRDDFASGGPNRNDGMYMSGNLGLYQFWLGAGYGDQIFYLPETETYVVAGVEGRTLRVRQMFGGQEVALDRLAASLGGAAEELVLEYTPARREKLLVRAHKEEDSTLFILGEDLKRVERERLMFPILSHA